tara:strand:- start:944 stop:1501 length:558 start_codon:yes stop_codon:yes gene_type:complete
VTRHDQFKEKLEMNRRRTLIEAVGWLVFIGIALYFSFDFNEPLPGFKFGAAHWPHVIIALMTVAAVILVAAQFLKGNRVEGQADQFFDEIEENIEKLTPRTVAMFILPLLWVLGMHKIGFLLATPIFIFICTWLMGIRSWKTLLGFTFCFYVSLVLIFYKWVFTPLPMGAGWFHSLNGEIIGLVQ